MLRDQINHIKSELKKYDDMTPSELLSYCIDDKLQTTLKRYSDEIRWNTDYLLTRSSFKILKALTKIQKNADKEVLKTLGLGEEDNE